MKTAIIILSILYIISVVFNLYYYFIYYKLFNHLCDDYKDEPHFCNHCNTGYIHSKEERAKTVCDYCKRPLTLHKKHPNFNVQEEQIDLPFEEYSNENK